MPLAGCGVPREHEYRARCSVSWGADRHPIGPQRQRAPELIVRAAFGGVETRTLLPSRRIVLSLYNPQFAGSGRRAHHRHRGTIAVQRYGDAGRISRSMVSRKSRTEIGLAR